MQNFTNVKKWNQYHFHLDCLAFLGLGKRGIFHWDDWNLVSGPYPYTQVSSPALIIDNKFRSTARDCFTSWHTGMRFSFWSGFRSLRTNFNVTLFMHRLNGTCHRKAQTGHLFLSAFSLYPYVVLLRSARSQHRFATTTVSHSVHCLRHLSAPLGIICATEKPSPTQSSTPKCLLQLKSSFSCWFT